MRFERNVPRLALIAAIMLPAHVAAQDGEAPVLLIEGYISVFNSEVPVEKAQVEIGGALAALAADGSFRHLVPAAPEYRITVSGDGFYTGVQTFAHTELRDEDCACLRVPAIEVVARREGRSELFFAGDAMAGRRYSQPVWGERQLVDPADPYPDLMRLLAPIRPYVEGADIASVNLETVLADEDPGASPPKSVVFYAPTALAKALADSGFDYVSLGNNHSYDYLESGLLTTVRAIEDAGLAWSGAGMDEAEALRPAQLRSGAGSFAMLGYVGWQGNVTPNQVAEADKGGAAHGTEESIRRTVADAAGAGQLPVVQLHGSREYSDRPTDISETRMLAAVEEGAIIVASHHPHVTQGIELRDGAIIAYSLGNFLFDQYFMLTQGTFALKVWVDAGVPVRAEVIPLRMLEYRPVPALGTARQYVLERVQRLSAERGTTFRSNGGHLLLDMERSPSVTQASDPEERQLVFWGDFENSAHGGALDRTLQLEGGELGYHFDPEEGTRLVLEPSQDARTLTLQPATFFRTITREQARFAVRIKTDQPLWLQVLLQHRPSGMGRFEALETQPFVSAGEVWIDADSEWQNIAGDFAVPLREDGSPAAFRMALRLHGQEALEPVQLDDLEVLTF